MSALAQPSLFPEAQLRPEDAKDERYTLRSTMSLCKSLAWVAMWDLDAAACAESHWADVWYGIDANGLTQPWFGRTWVNPPFSDLRSWVEKAWFEMERGDTSRPDVVAMLLPSNRTEQPFWQEHVEPYRDGRSDDKGATLETHFLPSRIQFGFPGNPLGINTKNSPPFGCVLLVWRRR